MGVGPDDEIRPIFRRGLGSLAMALAPVPLVGEQPEHDGFGRADGGGSDETGFRLPRG